jgi:hypothetical protein
MKSAVLSGRQINIAYAIEGSVIALGDEVFSLAADEALRIEPAGGTLAVRSGRVALASIQFA